MKFLTKCSLFICLVQGIINLLKHVRGPYEKQSILVGIVASMVLLAGCNFLNTNNNNNQLANSENNQNTMRTNNM